MFKSQKQITEFVNAIENFVNAVCINKYEPSLNSASMLNRKREALELCLAAASNVTPNTLMDNIEPACPECGSAMKQRTNRQNGEIFYGCVKYPNCRGTRDSNGLSFADRQAAKEQIEQQDGYSFNRKRNPVTEVEPMK